MVADTAFRSDESFSQEEFRRWLADRPRGDSNHYELLNGRIVMTPPAGWPHARIGTTLNRILDTHVSARGLGAVLDASAGFDLPSGDTVEPDVSFISAERFAAGPEPGPGQFLKIVPNLVVEILSGSTARRDRTEKKDVYERNGVNEYWLVDPERREVGVFVLRNRAYAAARVFTSGRVVSEVLPDLDVAAEALFTL